MKCAACTCLRIAYAGSAREDVMDLLLPALEQSSGGPNTTVEVALAGLALGMVYVGKCNEAVATSMVQRLIDHAKYLCVG